jgi:hypothetical protein
MDFAAVVAVEIMVNLALQAGVRLVLALLEAMQLLILAQAVVVVQTQVALLAQVVTVALDLFV